MRVPSSNNEIGWHIVLYDEVHRFDDISGKAEITPHPDVAEIKLAVGQNRLSAFVQLPRFGEAERSRRGMGNLLGHKTKRSAWALVIEQNTAGQVQPVLLAIRADDLMCIGLRN